MGVGSSGFARPWILKLLAKKVIFLISKGEKQISPLLAPLENFLGKSPIAPSPPGKNPSDAHVYSSGVR